MLKFCHLCHLNFFRTALLIFLLSALKVLFTGGATGMASMAIAIPLFSGGKKARREVNLISRALYEFSLLLLLLLLL